MSPKGDEMTSPGPYTVQSWMAPSTGRATSMRRTLGSTKASRRERCGLGVGDGFLPSILVGGRWGEHLDEDCGVGLVQPVGGGTARRP